jgi:hypothetical protein
MSRGPLAQRTRLLLDEARRAPTARALGIGLAAGVAAPAAGVAAGLVAREVLRAAAAEERLARNAADAATLGARLGPHCPPLGVWAAAPDFLELVVREVAVREPDLVVELGSGASTLAVAEALTEAGRGRLVSVEHDARFAAATRRRLERAGWSGAVELVVAPLRPQRFAGHVVPWYDLDAITAALGDRGIDLMVVDGPPSVSDDARWPAVPALAERLAAGAPVLLDDGRRAHETRVARRWARARDGRELYWHDTVKGTWRLVSGLPEPPALRLLRAAVARLNPHPSGFALGEVRRR